MSDLKKSVMLLGVKNLTIYVLIWLELKMMVNIVFSLEAKTQILSVFAKLKHFKFLNAVFNEDRDDLESLNELVSLQNQVKAVRLQDKLGKQNFHEDLKKKFKPVTDSVKNTPESLTKSITESSK